jgi:hypothetical protein
MPRLRPLRDVFHQREYVNKIGPRGQSVAETFVVFIIIFDGLIILRNDRRVVVYNGHDCGGCKTFKMRSLLETGRGRQERRNQNRSLLRPNRMVVLHCTLCEGFVRGAMHATPAIQAREHDGGSTAHRSL